MDNTEKQLKKVEKLFELISEEYVKPDEVVQLFEAVFGVIKDIKSQLEQSIADNQGELSNKIRLAFDTIKDIEAKTQDLVSKSELKTGKELDSIVRKIYLEFSALKDLIPKIPDLAYLENRIDAVEEMIPKIPPEITREQIRDKLETFEKEEDKLSADAIKGLDKTHAKLSDSIVNRALGIVDQRTSFLINKVSNLQTRVDAVGSGTGDVVGPASAVDSNFAAFDTTTGKLIKDSGYNASSFLTSLTGALLLDQTTPQTIINGTPIIPSINGSSVANGDLTLQGTSDATRTTSYVILQPTSGNVGIGTTSPSEKLHVVGNIEVNAGGFIGSKHSATLGGGASTVTVGNEADNSVTRTSEVRFEQLNQSGNTGGEISFWTHKENTVASTERMRITSLGNVGIGTTNPQTKLALSTGSAISFEASAGVTDIAITHTADTLTFTGGTIVLGTATATGGLTGNVTGTASGNVPYTGATTDVNLGNHTITLGVEGGQGYLISPNSLTNTIAGSDLAFQAGAGLTSGAGGNILYYGGSGGDTGAGGDVSFNGGGGGITSGNGGSINLNPGSGTAPGEINLNGITNALGAFKFQQVGVSAIMDATLLTGADKTFTFPDATGTIALTSNITGTNSGTNSGDNAANSSSTYIGTTAVALNRASAALTLAGITLTTPDIGTPSAGVLTNATGLPAAAVVAGTLTGTFTLSGTTTLNLVLPTSDHTAVGHVTNAFASGYTAAVSDLVFLGSGGKWLEVDADAEATCKGLLGIAMEAKNDTEIMIVALPGTYVRDDTWAWTVGATLYAGETLGTIQEAIPTGADAIIKVIGFAVSADVIYFYPSPDQQSVVA